MQKSFVRRCKRAAFFVEQLKHAGNVPIFIADGKTEQRARAESELLIEFTRKARVLVSIGDIESFAGAGHMAGQAFIDGHANFLLLESQTHERPYFLGLMVHQKYGAAFGAGLPGSQLKNNIDQLGQVDGGVKALGSFEDAGELLERVSALVVGERYAHVPAVELEHAARAFVQRLRGDGFEHAVHAAVGAHGPGGAASAFLQGGMF